MRLSALFRRCLLAVALAASLPASALSPIYDADARVRAAVLTVMKQHEIAGMAVAVTRQGEQHFYSFGLASWETRVPVTNDTLFDVGSISKTYSATLAAYAQALGRLSLADPVERHVPELAGSAFGKVSLLGLATHTAGGFPLQVPDTVRDRAQLMAYLQAWQPSYAEGTRRTYANPSIGMLGVATANAMGQAYVPLMQGTLLPKLGLPSTYLQVPADQMARYAQGYDKRNQPVRVSPGVLADEAYGVKTSARDLLRFVELNLGGTSGDAKLDQAIADTHRGYFELGGMTQDLVWEQYRYPAPLDTVLEGNSNTVAFETHDVRALRPPLAPRADAWINKTGATNGFGAYVAFVPGRRIGIVILANRNYPNADRVRLAYEVLDALETGGR